MRLVDRTGNLQTTFLLTTVVFETASRTGTVESGPETHQNKKEFRN